VLQSISVLPPTRKGVLQGVTVYGFDMHEVLAPGRYVGDTAVLAATRQEIEAHSGQGSAYCWDVHAFSGVLGVSQVSYADRSNIPGGLGMFDADGCPSGITLRDAAAHEAGFDLQGPCVLSFRFIFVPVNLRQHWFLLVADTELEVLQLFDGLPSHMPQPQKLWYLAALASRCQSEAAAYGLDVNVLSWRREIVPHLPQQTLCDCAVYTVLFARCVLSGKRPSTISNGQMSSYRRKLAARMFEFTEW
jgi:hypothetical protein